MMCGYYLTISHSYSLTINMIYNDVNALLSFHYKNTHIKLCLKFAEYNFYYVDN